MTKHQFRAYVWFFLDDAQWNTMCRGFRRIVDHVGVDELNKMAR